MVIGHIAAAYAVRAGWRRAELLPLLVATMLPDLADFVLPQGNQCVGACGLYSHAMPAVFVLAAAAGALTWVMWHRRATSLWCAALVLLHSAADLVTGLKPYWPGGPRLGSALYTRPVADFVLETAVMLAAWLLLRRDATAPRWARHAGALALLLLVQAAMSWWFWSRLPAAPSGAAVALRIGSHQAHQ